MCAFSGWEGNRVFASRALALQASIDGSVSGQLQDCLTGFAALEMSPVWNMFSAITGLSTAKCLVQSLDCPPQNIFFCKAKRVVTQHT